MMRLCGWLVFWLIPLWRLSRWLIRAMSTRSSTGASSAPHRLTISLSNGAAGDGLHMRRVHTVPVWSDGVHTHIAGIDEVRPDLEDYVIGWANIAEIDINGQRRLFLLVYKSLDDD